MSKYMINDSNAINDWNPYVVGDFLPPGTWSAPWPYSRAKVVEEQPSPPGDSEQNMVIMDSFLRGGGPRVGPIVSCPMSRPLEPQRLFDDELWPLYPKKENQTSNNNIIVIIVLLIVMFALYLKIA